MIYIVFYELAIIILVIVIIFKLSRNIKIKNKYIYSTQEQLKNLNQTLAKQSTSNNKPRNYRLKIFNESIEFTLLSSKDVKFNSLIGKKVIGTIEDISISGMKIKGKFNLPISANFIAKGKFTLKEESFQVKSLFIRKEEHLKDSSVIYGVHFIDMPLEIEKKLALCLHKLESERKENNSDINLVNKIHLPL